MAGELVLAARVNDSVQASHWTRLARGAAGGMLHSFLGSILPIRRSGG